MKSYFIAQLPESVVTGFAGCLPLFLDDHNLSVSYLHDNNIRIYCLDFLFESFDYNFGYFSFKDDISFTSLNRRSKMFSYALELCTSDYCQLNQ